MPISEAKHYDEALKLPKRWFASQRVCPRDKLSSGEHRGGVEV